MERKSSAKLASQMGGMAKGGAAGGDGGGGGDGGDGGDGGGGGVGGQKCSVKSVK